MPVKKPDLIHFKIIQYKIPLICLVLMNNLVEIMWKYVEKSHLLIEFK